MNIDIDQVCDQMEKLGKISAYCAKELEFNEVAKEFKLEIENYKNVVATLQALKDPALKEQNWVEIKTLVTPESELRCKYFYFYF